MTSLIRKMGSMLSRSYSEQPLDNLDRWIELGDGGGYSSSGTFVSEKRALCLPAAWACIDLISKLGAVLPGHVFRRDANGRDREKANDHYLYPIVHDSANPTLPANEWRRIALGHILGWGNHYSWIEWDRRPIPRYLWPLPPNKVKVQRKSATGPIQYFIQDAQGQWVEFAAEDILHVRGLGFDGTVGYSPVSMLQETFGLAMAQQQSAGAMHRNGISSRLVLEYAGTATPDQIKALSQSFQEANAGLGNAHKAIVLQAGFTAKPISISPRDAQFLEQSKYTDAKIYQIYGVPPHMVGDTEKATSWGTGIEQQTIGFVRGTLLPAMDLLETWMAMKLLPDRTEYFIEYDFKGLLRGDTAARAEWHRAMVEMGVYSPNDVLRYENEDPYEGGEVFRRPLNTAFVDKTGKVVALTPPGGAIDVQAPA